MTISSRLAWLCVGAFTLALCVQAAIEARPLAGRGVVSALFLDHAVGVVAGLLCGAVPFLVLLSRLWRQELRQRAAFDARSKGAAATRLADVTELSDANRLVTLGQLASMAHELGTPLGVVQARAQMIAGGESTGDDLKKDVEIILQQTRRMSQMVRDVLELAHRKPTFEKSVDLVTLVRQVAAMLAPTATSTGVLIKVLEPGAPAMTRGDASKLLQILTNLINNATESMPEGGTVTLTIGTRTAVSPADHGHQASLYRFVEVRDQGCGIDKQYLPRIFDTFFTTKSKGSGLGLAVSYRIAAEHGGWIAADSVPGEGSCFTLFLPSHAASE